MALLAQKKRTWFLLSVVVFSLILSSCGEQKPKIDPVRMDYLNRSLIASIIFDTLTNADKSKIDRWISDNNLNTYGDSKFTFYAGGSPVFNEATGNEIDRYEYILVNHLDLIDQLTLSVKDVALELQEQIESGKLVPAEVLEHQQEVKKWKGGEDQVPSGEDIQDSGALEDSSSEGDSALNP